MQTMTLVLTIGAFILIGLAPATYAYSEKEVDNGQGETVVIAAHMWWESDSPRGEHWGPYYQISGQLYVGNEKLDFCYQQSSIPTGSCLTSSQQTFPCVARGTAETTIFPTGQGVVDIAYNCD